MNIRLEKAAEAGVAELFRTTETQDANTNTLVGSIQVVKDHLVDLTQTVNGHFFLLVAAVLFWSYVNYAPFYQVLICVSLTTTGIYLRLWYIAYFCVDGEIKRIRRESNFFRAILEDAAGITSLSDQLRTKLELLPRDCGLVSSRAIAQLESLQLTKWEVYWVDEISSVVQDAQCLVEAFLKRREELMSSFSSVRCLVEIDEFFQWTRVVKCTINDRIVGRMAWKKAPEVHVCEKIEKLWYVIRKVLDRPIEQHESQWVKSILEVDTGDQLKSPLLQKVGTTIEILEENKRFGITEARNVELQLRLLLPFLQLIKEFRLESKIERAWLKEVYELVTEANVVVDKFSEARAPQYRWLRVPNTLRDWKARRKLKADINYIDVGFTDLFQIKESYLETGHLQPDGVDKKLKLLHDQLGNMCKAPGSNAGINRLREAWLKVTENTARSASESDESFSKDIDQIKHHIDEELKLLGDQLDNMCKAPSSNASINKLREDWLKVMVKIANSESESNESFSQDIDQIKHHIDILRRGITACKIEVRDESSSVVGLEVDVQEVVSKLTTSHDITEHQNCSSVDVVSIVGMEGVGKTTLAKRIYSHSAFVGRFKSCLWINVPGNCDNKLSFLENVAKQVLVYPCPDDIGLQEPSSNSDKHLWKKVADILSENKYFLVLDNVSTMQAWNTFKDMLRPKSDGSKIVLTTRNEDVGSLADPSWRCAPHRLRLRTKDESLSLLKQMVGISRKEEKMARWGVPLAFVRVGCMTLLQRETASKELDVVEKLESSFKKTNYSDFPPHLNQLLQHLQLFPRDLEIPARRLITLWVSEGLVDQNREENETPEQVAERRIFEFIDRGIFQIVKRKASGKVKACRLSFTTERLRHEFKLDSQEQQFEDVSRSVQRLAHYFNKKKQCLCLICSESLPQDEPEGGRKLHRYDPLEDDEPIEDIGYFLQTFIEKREGNDARISLDFRNLRSFLSFDPREGNGPGKTIGNFLRKGIERGDFQELRVLDLERTFRPELPDCIGKLKKLKYLGLRWTHLNRIPSSIGDLVHLETLDVKHTYLCNLPSSAWKLQSLRNLYLNQGNRCKFLRQPSDSFLKFQRQPSYSFLENLQILWGMCVYKDSPIEDCLDKLTNIRKLGMEFQLDVSEQTRILSERITKWTQLQTLRLRSTAKTNESQMLKLKLSHLENLSSIELYGMPLNPALVQQLPKKLTELTLSASGLSKDAMTELGSLSNLKILCFYSDSYKEKQMCCPKESFPQLRVLKLWKLKELEELIVEEKALQNLRELETRACPKMEVPKGLENLEMLLELKVTNMPDEFAMEIENEKSLIWGNSSHSPSIIIQKGEEFMNKGT
ncbi:NB-ARC domain, LRR domain containing protein [Trema orientale]|uniref:NB-ARC domain, LRR domain containing protein n=1 Tax=Trema orientale TaxID=63057 RepID=A0A2P5ETQ4_TREOI|nr:NB-ARC domain, LRR domain containing protein [Trema orientale]